MGGGIELQPIFYVVKPTPLGGPGKTVIPAELSWILPYIPYAALLLG